MQYTLNNGLCEISVDASHGARITAFSVNGQNALFTGQPEWGSTFWPSPQHAWGWPPPAVLDSGAYAASTTAESLEFVSPPCPITGLELTKTIQPSGKGFDVVYAMKNVDTIARTFAHWEISRVAGGLTFFASEQPPLAHSSLGLDAEQGCYWHEYDVERQTDNLKAFANGSAGWLANAHKGLLLLKRFAPVPAELVAPQEAEVEIYAHGDPAQPYIEVEQQGAYLAIAPGQTVQWRVHWSLFIIPEDVTAAKGSLGLLRWVEILLADVN